MKLLLDESLPRRLKNELSQHEVTTVPERGWAGKTNGELLKLASGSFDVFITADQGLEYQQNLTNVEIAVIVLRANEPLPRFEAACPEDSRGAEGS